MSSTSIHLLPDKTVIAQFLIFFSVFLGMSLLVFKPIIKNIRFRKERTTGLLEEAKRIEEKIADLSRQYTETLEKAREAAHHEKEEIKRIAHNEELQIKNSAKKEALKIIDETKDKIEAWKIIAQNELNRDVSKLVDEIITKVKQ